MNRAIELLTLINELLSYSEEKTDEEPAEKIVVDLKSSPLRFKGDVSEK